MQSVSAAYSDDNTISINFITHSHGGNATIMAINNLVDMYPDMEINSLVLLGTPGRDDAQLSDKAKKSIKNIVNVYSKNDIVQKAGGEVVGFGKRTNPDAVNIDITKNLKGQGIAGPIESHVEMHNNKSTINAVNRVIKKEEPEE